MRQLTISLVLTHRAIALVLLLALLPANGRDLICALKCDHLVPIQQAAKADPAMTPHQHSHHNGGMKTAKSACCPAGATLRKGACVLDLQSAAAAEVRTRIIFDSVAIALTSIFSDINTYSEISFLSSSPPASLVRTVVPTLRI